MKIEEEAVDEEWRLKRMSLMMKKKRERQRAVMKSRRLNSEVWVENCWCWGKKEIVAACRCWWRVKTEEDAVDDGKRGGERERESLKIFFAAVDEEEAVSRRSQRFSLQKIMNLG